MVSEAELKSILCSPASGLMLLNCIDTDKVKRSIPVLERFAREEYGL